MSVRLSLQPFEALRHLIGGLAVTSQTWHCRKDEASAASHTGQPHTASKECTLQCALPGSHAL